MEALPEFPTYDAHFVTPYLVVGPCPGRNEGGLYTPAAHSAEIYGAGVRGVLNLAAYATRNAFEYVHHLPSTVHWLHLGFWDGHLPDDEDAVPESLSPAYARFVVQKSAILLRDHSPLLVHCMGGKGRSANVAGILLAAREGISIEEAVARIQAVRPQCSKFSHDGFWKNVGGEALVELAATVLAETETDKAVLCERVRGRPAKPSPPDAAIPTS